MDNEPDRNFKPALLRLINTQCGDDSAMISRRQFIAAAAAATFLTGLDRANAADHSVNGIPYRTLGKTGERVSAIGLGGYHIGLPKEEEGLSIIRTAIDRGINFLDNCWDYNKGDSEVRMGKALKDGYRDKVFLMTKIDGRDQKTAAEQIDQSLKRLQTDRIDLVQFHEIIRMHDPDKVFDKGGALHAAIAAKKSGKIRYIGFTGHKDPKIHLKMLGMAVLNGFQFDTVQMPLNVLDAHFDSFEKQVLPFLLEHNIGVLGMKPMGGGIIPKTNAVTAIECLHYALSLPTSVVITGCDRLDVLEQAITAAKTFKPFTDKERAALLERTATVAQMGKFEWYKTTERFDGTTKHPEWCG